MIKALQYYITSFSRFLVQQYFMLGEVVVLRLAVLLGSCSYADIPLFLLYLPCNVYLPVSSVLLSSQALGPRLRWSMVLYFCNNVVHLGFVQKTWVLVLSCSRCPGDLLTSSSMF